MNIQKCPSDKKMCEYCDLGNCERLETGADYTAEAEALGNGIAWAGFWIGVGLVWATYLWKVV